ncbi:MAG: hypothetical protein K2Y22_17080 [Candidatus Obscuribacterales bacterium]|nr:hypothetical protein [Candidatus Obscuribacterales bacterium]
MIMKSRLVQCFSLLTALVLQPIGTAAYPEFQSFIEKNSGRTVNCAMCHTNPDGPIGDGEGQLGSLKDEQLKNVNKARSAMEPGVDVDSPIMNEFGNYIIKNVGMKKVLEAKAKPQLLAEALGDKSDLDADGIADAHEFLAGTDPRNKLHGSPASLFMINLSRQKFHIVMALVASVLIIFGFLNFIKALHILDNRKSKR